MTIAAPTDDDIRPTLEVIEFLARSANRVFILDALATGPIDRRELATETGFSRATLSRTLTAFEERGWVISDHDRFTLTQLGHFVADEFGRVVKRMAVVPGLGEVAQWFPDDRYGFDLADLATATIVRPKKEDALAPTNNVVKRIDAAGRVRMMSYSMLPDTLEACWRKVEDGDFSLELLLDPAVIEAIHGHPTMASQFQELIANYASTVYQSAGDLPYVVIVADDVVNFCLRDADGAPQAMIDTTEPAIHEWAEATIDAHCATAEQIRARSLSS